MKIKDFLFKFASDIKKTKDLTKNLIVFLFGFSFGMFGKMILCFFLYVFSAIVIFVVVNVFFDKVTKKGG